MKSATYLVLATLACWSTLASAMQLRTYSASRHDRFTGFPTAPVWNESAWFGNRAFAGVGWRAADSTKKRQFALVSPLHCVCANHYLPGVGSVIRFLNTDGQIIERTVLTQTAILNDANLPCDLALIKLDTAITTSDKIPHFAYLNLADEDAYLHTALTVFGWHARGGRGRITGFEDIEEPGLNLTRACHFDYRFAEGFQDDCYLESGDSGSPSFAMIGEVPALISIHTAIGDDDYFRYNYDTFVPHYIAKLDALMTPDGYQMTATSAQPTVLSSAVVLTPTQWRQAIPASCQFDLSNVGSTTANHANVILRFPATFAPTTLTGTGWTITNSAPGEYLLQRASISASETLSITATWTTTGTLTSMPIQMDYWADGVHTKSQDFNTDIAPSYQAWSAGLAQPGPTEDGDGDGLSNLLEYAFGGDATVASRFQPGGVPLSPQPTASGDTCSLSFPIRHDASLRGITYIIEYSSTLSSASWTTDPPVGMTTSDTPFSPVVSGFLRRTITFTATSPRTFCRVRVELNEGN